MRFTGLVIGVPREIMKGERRVSAVPDTVRKMVAEGAKVLVEKGAGEGSYFHDDQYAAAGAEIVASAVDLLPRRTSFSRSRSLSSTRPSASTRSI